MWFTEYSKYTVELVCSSTGMENNFNVLPASQITSFGVPYDYGSVMHYSATAFSKNGLNTIEPKVRQPSIYFSLPTCQFSGSICGSSFKS